MSDPIRSPHDPRHPDATQPPLTDVPPPKTGISPLLWILLLIALIAAAWYFLGSGGGNRDNATLPTPANDAVAPLPDTTTPTPAARPAPRERPATPARPADRGPEVATRVEPEYPAAARRAGETGSVVVTADIDARGMPSNVVVTERSGSRSRDFDRAAVKAVSQWTFEPAIQNGKAVAASVRVPVDFTLQQ